MDMGQQIPAALAGSMGKEKKPFTYLPGGLDFSEIRSPRMAKRLARHQAAIVRPDGPPKRNAMISIPQQPQQPYQPQPPRPPPPPQQQQQATPQTNGAPGSRPTFQKQRSISEMLSFSEPESGPPSPKAMPSTQDQKPMYNPYEVDRKKQESTIIPSSPPPPPPAPPAPIAQSTSNNKNIPPPPPPPPPMMSFPQDEYTYNTENKHKSNKVKSALASLHKEKAEKLKSEEIEREQQVSEDIQTNNVDEMMPQYEQPIQNGVLSAEDQERLWREQQDFIEQQRRESMELSHQNSINQEMYGEQGRLAQSGQTQSSFDETDEMKAFEEAHRQANVSQELRKLEQPQEDLAQLQRQESRRREEEAIRKQEEEIRRYEEEKQRMVKEQEEKQKEEQLRAEEVMRIRQEEQRRREIEQQRFHEQQRILQEAQRRQQEDEQRRKEQEQRIIEEERARQAELQKQKDEEAKRQMAEQHRQRQAQERERILNNQRLEAERRESERQEKEESERRQQLLNSNSNQNNSRKELPKLMVNAAPPERHVHFNDELRKSYSPLSAYNSPFVLESMDHNEILPDEQNVNGDTQKLDPKDIYAETLRAKMNRQAINEAMERQRASLSPQPVQQNFQPNFTNDIRLNQNNNGQSPIINGISNQLSSNSSSPNEGVFEVPVNFIQKAANGPRMVSNSEDRISIMPNVAQPWSPTFNSNNGASIRSPPAPIASPPQAMSPPPKWTKPISPQPSRNVPVNYSWTPKKSDAPIKRNIPIQKIPATSNDQVPMSQAPQQSSLYYTMPGRPIGRNVAQTPPPIRQIPVQTMPTRTSRTPPPTRQAGFKNGNPYFQQNVNTNEPKSPQATLFGNPGSWNRANSMAAYDNGNQGRSPSRERVIPIAIEGAPNQPVRSNYDHDISFNQAQGNQVPRYSKPGPSDISGRTQPYETPSMTMLRMLHDDVIGPVETFEVQSQEYSGSAGRYLPKNRNSAMKKKVPFKSNFYQTLPFPTKADGKMDFSDM